MEIGKINRLEVIDQTGRVLVLNSVSSVVGSLQDEKKTLKIFLHNNEKPEKDI